MLLAERLVELAEQLSAFVRRRVVETSIVLGAIVLRFSMLLTFHPNNGYDAYDHYVYVQWIATHHSLPDLWLSRATDHPPLFYAIEAAFFRGLHPPPSLLALPSVMFSSATMLLIWFGLERHLPRRRLARIVGLTLAAIMPAAVHLSGMVTAEGMNGMLAAATLLMGAEALRRQQRGQRFIWQVLLTGLLAGLQMLTKISALVIFASVLGGAAFAVLFGAADRTVRLRQAATWLLVVVTFGGTCGWYLVRNQRRYHKPVLSGFDGPDGASAPKVGPYWKRRPPEFFYGWSNDVLSHPYAPSGETPRSYFWPVVVASTFVDYYNYGFVRGPEKPSTATGNWKALRDAAVPFSQASAVGGLVIAVSTVVAWFWALIVCVRRRQAEFIPLLLAPALAVIGQLHFVVAYPFDYQGPIKGVYMQFGMAPLFGLFGLAVDKMMRRRATRWIAFIQCAAVVAVASYTIYARAIAL
ncbi:MAG TPA: glycosyltransferase family 39 protein [Polyangia bacterium]|nr:glycosyltransferase family 39 protein [Polyangia bacterium]